MSAFISGAEAEAPGASILVAVLGTAQPITFRPMITVREITVR